MNQSISSETILICKMDKDGFSKAIIELVKEDWKVKNIIIDLVCSCPNVMTQI